jgi:4-hydroxy-tetrahydrodipicolinate synthase
MSVELILQLVREVPNIVAIKAEALPSPSRIAALRQGMSETRSPSILTGLGGLYGLFDLERGSDGFNTGFAFPEVLIEIVRAFHASPARARDLFTRYLPVITFEQQPGVAIRKEILRRRGLVSSNRVRHPGATIDPATAGQLTRLLDATFPGQSLQRPLSIAL